MDFDFKIARNSLHQLNNKIAVILNHAELLQMGLTGDREKERLRIVITGALDAKEIVAGLMQRLPKPEPTQQNNLF